MTSTTPSVLVVDDDADTCRNLSDILADLGYHVDTAPNGPAALELVRRRPYDVALLDYRMPGMDGLTLYREIKRLRAGTVAIVVTAYAGAFSTEEFVQSGAWQVLAKPVDFARLLALVERAAGEPLILVVDDDHDLCANLWDLFRERGYRVAVAHDEGEAERQMGGAPYRVVLIDLKLPTGDGTEVFRRVRQADPGAHIVVITGHHDMDPLVRQLLDEGAEAVCYKPFDVPALLGLLDRLSRDGTPPPAASPKGGEGRVRGDEPQAASEAPR